MFVREYKDSDLEALRAIHAAQGFDYALPDLRNPLFVTKLILERSAPNHICHSERRADEIRPQSRNLSSCCTNEASEKTLGASGMLSAAGEGNCRILGAALLRLTAEAYLLLDPRATRRRRARRLAARP